MKKEKNVDFFAKYIDKTQKYIEEKVKNPASIVLFFGAGASYGSDNSRLVKNGKLPPLGCDLYKSLVKSSEMKCWKKIPRKASDIFEDDFELGLRYMMDNDSKYKMFYELLIELALYFSKFEPEQNNLYNKLAQRIYGSQTNLSIITLNYDPILQHSLRMNNIFPFTIGIQQTDLINKPLKVKFLDVIYPHGACQFNYNCPTKWEDQVFNDTIDVLGGGLCQCFHKVNIVSRYVEKKGNFVRSMPIMCAYEPDKRPFGRTCFIDYQREYYDITTILAQRIIIVGVNCNYEKDRHLWESLERTNAEIIFVEPSDTGIEKIKQWNKANVITISKSFKDAFEDICEFAHI